jgi:hypothetical protein
MKSWHRVLFRTVLIGTLYLLASPVYLLLGAARLGRTLTAFSTIGSGRVICVHCGHENVLNRFATCNRCHATEYGSLLYCSFCRQVSRCLACEECGVTLRVIPEGWW